MANVINGTTTDAPADVVTLAPVLPAAFIRAEGAVQNTGVTNGMLVTFRSTDLLDVVHTRGCSLGPGKAIGFDTISLGIPLPVKSFTVAVQSQEPGSATGFRMTGEQF